MIRLAHHWTGPDGVAHMPGDVLDLGDERERALVAAGFAHRCGGLLDPSVLAPLPGEKGPEEWVHTGDGAVVPASVAAAAAQKRGGRGRRRDTS